MATGVIDTKTEVDQMVERAKAAALDKLTPPEIADALLKRHGVDSDLNAALTAAFADLLLLANVHAQRQAEAQAEAKGEDPEDADGRADPSGVVRELTMQYHAGYILELVKEHGESDLEDDDED
jgi:hypothetical protein